MEVLNRLLYEAIEVAIIVVIFAGMMEVMYDSWHADYYVEMRNRESGAGYIVYMLDLLLHSLCVSLSGVGYGIGAIAGVGTGHYFLGFLSLAVVVIYHKWARAMIKPREYYSLIAKVFGYFC